MIFCHFYIAVNIDSLSTTLYTYMYVHNGNSKCFSNATAEPSVCKSGSESEKCPDISPDPPRSPKTDVSPSGDVVEGISITLTCSSEAKPAVHTYTWYKRSGTHSSKLGVGQNYSIPNVTCRHSGVYHCHAENLKGSANSTPVFVNVLCK